MAAPPRYARVALLVTLCLVTGVVDAFATHLAYATLSWRRVPWTGPGEIKIRIEFEFGYDDDFQFPLPPVVGGPVGNNRDIQVASVNGGSVAYSFVTYAPEVVKYLSPAEALVVTGGFLELVVPSTAFPIVVDATSADRLSTLREGNNDRAQNLRMVIDPSRTDRSPQAVSVPRIYLPLGQPFSSNIFYVRGNRVTFASSADSGLVTIAPNGTAACPSTGCLPTTEGSMQLNQNGEISWLPTIEGLYAAQFRIAAHDPFLSTESAAVPLDTTFEVVAPCPGCGPRPEFTTPESINVQPGTNVSMQISASSAASDRRAVTLIPLMLPPNATFAQTDAGPNAVGVLSWMPTTADSGTNLACFRAIDSHGQVNFGLYCTTIDVWFTVTFNGRGGTPVPAVQSVPRDGYATSPTTDPTRPTGPDPVFGRYYFVGWGPFDSDEGPPFPFETFAITGDTAIYAMWTNFRYTVSFDSTGGSAVPSQLVPKRTVPIEPVPPTREGYIFSGWYQEPSLVTPVSFVEYFGTPILRATAFYAKWTANTYAVSFSSNGGTSVPTQIVASGATATTPAPPTRTGYTFGGWYSDAGMSQAFNFGAPITADLTLNAKWARVTYTFSGFLSPVDDLPIMNVGLAGRTFPVKWRLALADGTRVTALSSFASFSDAPIACDAAPASVLEEQLAATTSGIRYDAAADQFIYNWQTSRGTTGCRLVTITLDDGTHQYAKFQLR